MCICIYICRLTLGECPAANRTYATYGSPVTADVIVHVSVRMRGSEQYSTCEIAAALRHVHCLSVLSAPVLSLCLFVCLPLCLSARLLVGLSVCWSLSFYLSCPTLLGTFLKETCHFSSAKNTLCLCACVYFLTFL